MKTTMLVVLMVLALCLGCSKKNNPWLDQGEYDVTVDQLNASKNAVIRLSEAERAALAEEDFEAAAKYRVARDEYEAKIPELEQRFKILEQKRVERLEKQHEQHLIRGE